MPSRPSLPVTQHDGAEHSEAFKVDVGSPGFVGPTYAFVPMATVIPLTKWITSGGQLCGPFAFDCAASADNLMLSMYMFDDQFPARCDVFLFNETLLIRITHNLHPLNAYSELHAVRSWFNTELLL